MRFLNVIAIIIFVFAPLTVFSTSNRSKEINGSGNVPEDRTSSDVSKDTMSSEIKIGSFSKEWYWIVPPKLGKRLNGLSYGGNTFVALLNPLETKVITIGMGTVLTSHDGIDWSEREIATGGFYSGITYGNNIFVAVGRGKFRNKGGSIATSNNGIDWIERARPTNDLKNVIYGNNIFVAIGLRGSIVTSKDGINWSESISEDYGHLYGGVYGNNTFVLVGDVSILVSPDAVNWDVQKNQEINIPFGLRNITYGNNVFIIWIENDLLISPDGTNWVRKKVDIGFREVVYVYNTFLAVDDDGNVLTSSNGMNWTQRTKITAEIKGLNCRNHKCIVMGKNILLIP